MFDSIRALFKSLAPAVDFCALRVLDERSEEIMVRQNILQPLSISVDRGAMVTIIHRGGYGYAATSDLSAAGLKDAIARAKAWAEASSGRSVTDYSKISLPRPTGSYHSPRSAATPTRSRRQIIELLMAESASCQIDDRIVDWDASLWTVATDQLYLTADGADALQQFSYMMPNLSVSANAGADTQTRSFGGRGLCRQGDLSVFLDSGILQSGKRWSWIVFWAMSVILPEPVSCHWICSASINMDRHY